MLLWFFNAIFFEEKSGNKIVVVALINKAGDVVSSKLPAYSVFIDFFTEKKTLLVSFINSRWELPHPANASQRIYTHAA
jgi:hypothetical protein